MDFRAGVLCLCLFIYLMCQARLRTVLSIGLLHNTVYTIQFTSAGRTVGNIYAVVSMSSQFVFISTINMTKALNINVN